jgi:predicted SPOUT superfamily RNA methylase MTH1
MELDLIVDLNTEDDTGLPWTLLRNARHPDRVVKGAYIVAGSASVYAVAEVVDIADGVVWVRPVPGTAEKNRHLLTTRLRSSA